MAATPLTVFNLGENDDVPLTIPFSLVDSVNGNSFTNTGKEKVFIKTSASGAAGSITLSSGIHPQSGRSKTVSFALTSLSSFIPIVDFDTDYWNDTDGLVQITFGAGTNCVIAIVK